MILPLNLAFADGSTSGTGSNVLNGQIDFQVTSSNLNTNVSTVNGSVSNASSAVGNNLEVVTMDNTVVTNNQYVSGVSISADQTANVNAVSGSVNLQSQAICNAADVSTDPHVAAVSSNQVCNANDPSSYLAANVSNVGNGVTLGAQSIGNSFSEDTNAATMPVQNIQTPTEGGLRPSLFFAAWIFSALGFFDPVPRSSNVPSGFASSRGQAWHRGERLGLSS
jgi:hypothetical protein